MKKLNYHSKVAEVFLQFQKPEGFFIVVFCILLLLLLFSLKKSISRLLLGRRFKLSGDDLAHHEML